MNKLLIICGPTATGKTDLGIILAKKYNGEIVSADSRQVYRGMDIITGKDLNKISEFRIQNSELNIENERLSVGFREKDGIPIWLVDIVDPNYVFNAGEYSQLARRVIEDIQSRNKLPIVVGGTGFYIKSIVEPMETLNIPPNNKLRKKLQNLDVKALQQKLTELDRARMDNMNSSDRENSRRLIRAIEVAEWREQNYSKLIHSFSPDFSILWFGLKAPLKKYLYDRIDQRVEERIKEGAIEEAKQLKKKGYSWYLPALTSTGCSAVRDFIEKKEDLSEVSRRWKFQEHAYAVKQIAWFKKEERIIWFDITQSGYLRKIEEEVEKWYTTG